MSLWNELKRRNVFRVAAAYLVIAWLIVQVADVMADGFGFPEWFMPMLFVLLGLGFPVALVFSWAFEITPEGVKRERDVDRESSIAPHTGKRLNLVTIGAVILAVLVLGMDRFWLANRMPPDTSNPTDQTASVEDTEDSDPETVESKSDSTENSIAVLPFADMSPDGDQEYFSDGLSEEILNLLAQIKELKVISRTSSFAFKGQNIDVREIGERLGAAHVLEGSVRKAGEQLRITAQLIEAEDGSHLWSESYDRRLENVFAIQDDIAGAIVEALEVSLTGSERRAADEHGTDSMPAYERFLEARRLIQQRSRSNLDAARGLLDEALERDPDYAPALAARAQVALLLSDTFSTYGEIPLAEAVAEAEPLIKRALSLDPELATAHAVRGLIFSLLRESDRASEAFARALELNPSHADALNWRMLTLGSAGRLEERIMVGRRAAEIDPLNRVARANHAASYASAGRTDEALETAASLQHDFPDYAFGHMTESYTLHSSGRPAEALPVAERALELAPDNSQVQILYGDFFYVLGHYDRVLALPEANHGAALIALGRPDEAVDAARARLAEAPDAVVRLEDLLQTLSLAGRHDEVQALYTERWDSPVAVEETFGADTETSEMAPIAAALRARGRDEELAAALEHWGERLEFMREHGYAFSGFVLNEARHAALSGNRAQAIETLTRAIDLGYRDPLLARDPAFAELADDPDFQAQVDRMIELINAERSKLDLEPLT
ncbi:TPR end-of-group domain-containing protein [Wenzhouxiangella sp. EGI_FJ10305]|uniref:TPR end-of-group domain-containing protein n=1 Tax=Wenzhouxiangella sp. EGI_FJ10305 TaxID=3243768 RepID=UPI0035E38427